MPGPCSLFVQDVEFHSPHQFQLWNVAFLFPGNPTTSHTHRHTHTHTHIHTHTQWPTRTSTHAHTHTRTHTHNGLHAHTGKNTYVHTCTHTSTNTHRHAHTLMHTSHSHLCSAWRSSERCWCGTAGRVGVREGREIILRQPPGL
jgi:hypothetical protein